MIFAVAQEGMRKVEKAGGGAGSTDNTGSCVDLDRKARSGALDVGCYEFGGTTPPEPQAFYRVVVSATAP